MKNERLYNYENISRNKEHFKKATDLDHEPFSIYLNLRTLAKTAKIKILWAALKGYLRLNFLYCQAQWIY